MKCSNCGAELAQDVAFCRECGAKIESKKIFCRECGSELTEGMKFCSNCGAKTELDRSFDEDVAETSIPEHDADRKIPDQFEGIKSRFDTVKDDLLKAANISESDVEKKISDQFKNIKGTFDAAKEDFQKAARNTTNASRRDKQKNKSVLLPLLGIVIFFIAIVSLIGGIGSRGTTDNPNKKISETPTVSDTSQTATPLNYSIEKGTEYAYMVNEWNVYIATAISDSIIQIERWDKTMNSDKKVSLDSAIGTYKINDEENGFEWIDDSKTAFRMTVKDKNVSAMKKGKSVIFTINISDSDVNKGSDYNEDIPSFVYTNDDWHMYRAIPLTDTLIKIECWYRGSSSGKHLFGYDVDVIDVNTTTTDFQWTDDEHTSFTITMKDPENDYYWKKESFTLFVAEQDNYKYSSVKDYLGDWIVEEGEAKVPQDASSYKYDNYQEVEKSLTAAGFTNISYDIKYDIFFGITSEGEVDSVSIDGNKEFKKGDIFKEDAPIVITYHMKEEDDPNKEVETETSKKSESETNKSEDESTQSGGTAVSYSTNTSETVKNGNAGVYSYKSRGGSYDIYWIIDFDEGYVYWFTDGNGETTCDRLKIDSGDLNSVLIITYHDGGDTWSEGLHFKYVNHPDHLIMQDNDGFEYDYYTTSLSSALSLKNSKTIVDY